jgi:glycosyltransferase involved in cell wall biosynthesis
MPTVSVITPCYNAAAFIEETMASVRAQERVEWEHIVVDDGSADDSAARVAAVAATDPRVVLVEQQNSGVHVARGTGAKRADPSSRYLMFLDADDYLAPDFLSTLVEHLEQNPAVGLVYCAWTLVEQDGSPVDEHPDLPPRYVRDGLRIRELAPDDPETPLDALVSRHEAIPSTAVLRRSVFDRTRGWRRFGVVEDKDMVLQMALLARVHFLPRRLSYYRRTDTSRSQEQFYESMDQLHSAWWNDRTLDPAQRRAIRRAIVFDRRVAATNTGREAVRQLRDREFRDGVELGARALKRFGEAAVLSAKASIGARAPGRAR